MRSSVRPVRLTTTREPRIQHGAASVRLVGIARWEARTQTIFVQVGMARVAYFHAFLPSFSSPLVFSDVNSWCFCQTFSVGRYDHILFNCYFFCEFFLLAATIARPGL